MARRVPVFKRVAAHCLANGITAEELARRTKMHPQRAQRLLSGKTRMLAEDVAVIARETDTTVAKLYGDDEENLERVERAS